MSSNPLGFQYQIDVGRRISTLYNSSMSNSTSLAEIRQILIDQKPVLARDFCVDTLAIFGSYVRNEQTQGSDLDLLVTFSKAPGLLKFIELERYLSNMLRVNVDLVMKEALKPRIGHRILQEIEVV
jgi:uncharacterized protein